MNKITLSGSKVVDYILGIIWTIVLLIILLFTTEICIISCEGLIPAPIAILIFIGLQIFLISRGKNYFSGGILTTIAVIVIGLLIVF